MDCVPVTVTVPALVSQDPPPHSPSFRAKPKSMILSQWLLGLTQTMFSGLRSRWTTSWPCMNCSPSRICRMYWALLGSVCSKSSSTMRSKSSPPATLKENKVLGTLLRSTSPEEKPHQGTQTQCSRRISPPVSPGSSGSPSILRPMVQGPLPASHAGGGQSPGDPY